VRASSIGGDLQPDGGYEPNGGVVHKSYNGSVIRTGGGIHPQQQSISKQSALLQSYGKTPQLAEPQLPYPGHNLPKSSGFRSTRNNPSYD